MVYSELINHVTNVVYANAHCVKNKCGDTQSLWKSLWISNLENTNVTLNWTVVYAHQVKFTENKIVTGFFSHILTSVPADYNVVSLLHELKPRDIHMGHNTNILQQLVWLRIHPKVQPDDLFCVDTISPQSECTCDFGPSAGGVCVIKCWKWFQFQFPGSSQTRQIVGIQRFIKGL